MQNSYGMWRGWILCHTWESRVLILTVYWWTCMSTWWLKVLEPTWWHRTVPGVCLLSEILPNGVTQFDCFTLQTAAPPLWMRLHFLPFHQWSPPPSKQVNYLKAKIQILYSRYMGHNSGGSWLHLDAYILPLECRRTSHWVSQNFYAPGAFTKKGHAGCGRLCHCAEESGPQRFQFSWLFSYL